MSQLKYSDVMFTLLVVSLFDVLWQITKLIIITVWSFAAFFVGQFMRRLVMVIEELWTSVITVIITVLDVFFKGVKSKIEML